MTNIVYVTYGSAPGMTGVKPGIANNLIRAFHESYAPAVHRRTGKVPTTWDTLNRAGRFDARTGGFIELNTGVIAADELTRDALRQVGLSWSSSRVDQCFLQEAYSAAAPYIEGRLPELRQIFVCDHPYPARPGAGHAIRLGKPLSLPEGNLLAGAIGIVEGIVDAPSPTLSVVFRCYPTWQKHRGYEIVRSTRDDGIPFTLSPGELKPTGKFADLEFWDHSDLEYQKRTGRKTRWHHREVPVWEW